ncbi:MAG TPA: hypothetical protein VGH73_15580 [Thermoanaerobaculia bacterium]
MGTEDPDLSLLEPRRWGLVPTLLILVFIVGGAWLLWVSPPTVYPKPPKPTKQTAAKVPLYVSLVPAAAEGWCCEGSPPALSPASRAACEARHGTFFGEEKEARRACSRPPGR